MTREDVSFAGNKFDLKTGVYLLYFSLITSFYVVNRFVACPTQDSRCSAPIGHNISDNVTTINLISSGYCMVSLVLLMCPIRRFTLDYRKMTME